MNDIGITASNLRKYAGFETKNARVFLLTVVGSMMRKRKNACSVFSRPYLRKDLMRAKPFVLSFLHRNFTDTADIIRAGFVFP